METRLSRKKIIEMNSLEVGMRLGILLRDPTWKNVHTARKLVRYGAISIRAAEAIVYESTAFKQDQHRTARTARFLNDIREHPNTFRPSVIDRLLPRNP